MEQKILTEFRQGLESNSSFRSKYRCNKDSYYN